MSERDNQKDTQTEEPTGLPDDLIYVLETGVEEEIVHPLEHKNIDCVRELIEPLHYADVADLLERLDAEDRARLVEIIRIDFDAAILSELDETVRDQIIDLLGLDEVAVAVSDLDTDDAVTVLEELDEAEQRQVLNSIPAAERTVIEEGLAYPKDSAGRLMQREFVSVPEGWTVGETIDYMRASVDSKDNNLPDYFYSIFVVDPDHKPVGKVMLDQLLRTRRPVKMTEIVEPEKKVVAVTMDQEDVAFLFRQRDLVSAPVVDELGRLVGVVTIDDIVDVIDEEHEEDIMYLAGIGEDDLYDAAIDTTRARFSWLAVNLLTAIVASLVISLFDATIDQLVALAILMPIVASMGGNAGTQTLTVTVRALAMKELTATNAARVIGKEILVGAINGVLFAVFAGVIVWVWFGSQVLGLVIGLAMVVNMTVAGLAGTTIPLMLEHARIDPAIASSVFLTTVTDVVGFFVFLGLAAIILL